MPECGGIQGNERVFLSLPREDASLPKKGKEREKGQQGVMSGKVRIKHLAGEEGRGIFVCSNGPLKMNSKDGKRGQTQQHGKRNWSDIRGSAIK